MAPGDSYEDAYGEEFPGAWDDSCLCHTRTYKCRIHPDDNGETGEKTGTFSTY